MLEFTDVQQVAHKLENVYDLLRKDRMPLTESGVNLLFEGRDVLTALVRAASAAARRRPASRSTSSGSTRSPASTTRPRR